MQEIFSNLINTWSNALITLISTGPLFYIFGSLIIFITLSLFIKLLIAFR